MCFLQQVKSLGVPCVTQRVSSQTCCSVRVVAYIIMQLVLRLVPHPSSGQDGNAQSVKCARLAGKSSPLQDPQYKILNHFLSFISISKSNVLILNFIRQPGEDSKMLVCDACDKGYHTFCLQPAMDSLPTDPWKCRVSHIYHSSLCKEMPPS